MSWQVQPAGFDLYDGLPGISLYLNHWLRFNQDATLAALNQQLNQQLLSAIGQIQQPGKPGTFTGTAGQLYWLEQCCETADPAVQQVRSTLLEQLCCQTSDQLHDIIDGAAGCLLVLCFLHERQPEPVISQLARECVRQLMSGRVNQTIGCGWLMPELQHQPVSGFAHGGLGVAYALARYATTFGDASPLSVIGDALAYEHHLFSSQQNRWMDSRKGAEYRSVNAWCTGGVGAGITALELSRLLPEHTSHWCLPQTIHLATQAAMGQLDTLSNDSLCHGTTGILYLLHEVSREHPVLIQADQYQRLKQHTISRMQRLGIRCGLPKIPLTLPGLMRGVCGVGLELLRQETNNQTPNVLTLS
jgi:lantibiotic modifying enzyme